MIFKKIQNCRKDNIENKKIVKLIQGFSKLEIKCISRNHYALHNEIFFLLTLHIREI